MEAENRHVIGYFDLMKNRKENGEKLETDEDFRRAASKCFDNADSFLRFASYPFTLRCLEDIMSAAAFSNSAFACELFLKTLLLSESIEPSKNHKLDELFDKISSNIQDEIIRDFPMGEGSHTRDKQEFMLQLHENRDAFAIMRYSYEMDGFAFQYEFVLNLALSLREAARKQLSSFGVDKPEGILFMPTVCKESNASASKQGKDGC